MEGNGGREGKEGVCVCGVCECDAERHVVVCCSASNKITA